MVANNEVQSELNYLHFVASTNMFSMHGFKKKPSEIIEEYYQDAIAIFIKGLERELVKILTLHFN